MDRHDRLNLKKRYLIWLYKTTKEALDRIERKFTQLEIDRFLLNELSKHGKEKKVRKFIAEFAEYIKNKEKDALTLKYENNGVKSDYHFLVLKLKAVEDALVREFDKKTLKTIKSLYEKEMVERILKNTEHR